MQKNAYNRLMPKRITLEDTDTQKSFDLELPILIGRGQHVDLSFPDPAISHRHALISEKEDKIWLQDLESANGVLINGLKVEDKAVLKPGDLIQFGLTKLLFRNIEKDFFQETLILQAVEPKTEWGLDHEKLKLIYEMTAELSESQDLSLLGQNIFSKFWGIFKQDRGYLALFQEDGSLKPVFLDFSLQTAPISRTIVNRLLKSGESFLLEDALSDTSFKEQESVMALRIRSALCVPLLYHNQIYGLIYLDRSVPGAYKQDDLEFLRAIALILAPLIENARLWSELKQHYDRTVEALRETEERLLDMERTAAYARLAQSVAHEIRNPLMTIGGLVRRIERSAQDGPERARAQIITKCVERIENVLREVDNFVSYPSPQKKLDRLDLIMQEEIDKHRLQWDASCLRPMLCVETSNVMVPVDRELFKKALKMIFGEITDNIKGICFNITIQDYAKGIAILIGPVDGSRKMYEPHHPDLLKKPWRLSLFLNMAQKIIIGHGGKLFFDPDGEAAFPIMIRLPRLIKA